jgi:chondroitin AC lyase
MAYIFLNPAAVRLHMGTDTGSWRTINLSEPEGLVKERVFTPIMIHPSGAQRISTGYVLAFCGTATAAQSLAQRPSWKILRNDRNCQAVQFDDGVTGCAFYTAGSLVLDGKKTIAVDKGCLILLSGGLIYVGDPSHKGQEVTITINKKVKHIALPKDGTTIHL